jgi:hypothetical protein
LTSTVRSFHPREGGVSPISITDDDDSGAGKSAGNVDADQGYFRELLPDRGIVEVIEVDTSDSDLKGAMTITTSREEVGDTSKVVAAFDGLPEGVSLDDYTTGTAMSLSK